MRRVAASTNSSDHVVSHEACPSRRPAEPKFPGCQISAQFAWMIVKGLQPHEDGCLVLDDVSNIMSCSIAGVFCSADLADMKAKLLTMVSAALSQPLCLDVRSTNDAPAAAPAVSTDNHALIIQKDHPGAFNMTSLLVREH